MGETSPARRSRELHISLPNLLLLLLLQSTAGRELKFVLLLYRHGDRSPIESYPTSLHKENEWPQGYGQLTAIGMQQQYELGQYIKKRYSNFLSHAYKREEILVLSSETDRTIMSAQANLAGMFPPTGEQIWNPDLLWQPIPVYVVPKANNPKLRFPIFDCPRYRKLLKETMASNEFQAKIKQYEEFIQTIALYAGYNPHTLKYVDNFKLWHIQDTLFCESIHNYTLPKWATEDIRAKLGQLTVISLSSLFGIYKREEKARLQGGNFPQGMIIIGIVFCTVHIPKFLSLGVFCVQHLDVFLLISHPAWLLDCMPAFKVYRTGFSYPSRRLAQGMWEDRRKERQRPRVIEELMKEELVLNATTEPCAPCLITKSDIPTPTLPLKHDNVFIDPRFEMGP